FVGQARHNAVVGNIIGREPRHSKGDTQRVGVWLRPTAGNNTVVQNILYKNVTAWRGDAKGNGIDDNTVVSRGSDPRGSPPAGGPGGSQPGPQSVTRCRNRVSPAPLISPS